MTVKTSNGPQFVRSKLMFISLLLSIIKTSSTDFEAVSHTQFLGFGQFRALASARGSVATRGPEGPEGGNTAARGPEGPESVETEGPNSPR